MLRFVYVRASIKRLLSENGSRAFDLVLHDGSPNVGGAWTKEATSNDIEFLTLKGTFITKDAYVICKIFQKGGLGPKNGAQYGALFNEDEWDDMDEMFVDSQPVAHQISSKNVPPVDINNIDAVSLSVPRDLLVNFVPELDSSKCLPQNTVMQPSKKKICGGSSAVDPHILPDYVPPGTIGSSAAICMTAPGNLFPLSTSMPCPSTAGLPVMDISPDIDVLSLLNMFTEDMNMPPVENNSIEDATEKIVKLLECKPDLIIGNYIDGNIVELCPMVLIGNSRLTPFKLNIRHNQLQLWTDMVLQLAIMTWSSSSQIYAMN